MFDLFYTRQNLDSRGFKMQRWYLLWHAANKDYLGE